MARSSARVSSVLLIHYPDASCRQYYVHSGVVWIDDTPRFLKKVGNLLSLKPNLRPKFTYPDLRFGCARQGVIRGLFGHAGRLHLQFSCCKARVLDKRDKGHTCRDFMESQASHWWRTNRRRVQFEDMRKLRRLIPNYLLFMRRMYV